VAILKVQKQIKRINANLGLTSLLFLLFLLAGAVGYADDARITKTVEINYLGDLTVDNTGNAYIVVQDKNSLIPKLISACSTPTISISGTNVVCIGQSATITATGASSYTWNTSDTSATIILSPTVTTTYTVTGANTGGCMATQTVIIIVNTLPTITVNTSTICAGDSAILIAHGASTYTWNTTATTATITPSLTITTNFTVTGTDTNGCVNTDTIRVTVNTLPPVTAHLTSTFTPICSGDSITLSQSGANTYTWTSTSYTFTSADTVANGVKFPPKMGTDTFTVKGKDTITGCVNTATISVVVKQSPNIMVTPPSATICPGGSASFTVSGGAGVISYTWSPTTNLSPSASSTTIIVSPTVSTSYQVIGIDTNGCVSGNGANVIIPQDTIIVNSAVICLSNSVTLNASSIVTTYTWSPSTGLSNTSGSSVIASPRNTTVYTISGTDAFGCMGINTATVTVDSLPIISISTTPTITCSGQPAVLMASGASTYTWSTGTVAVINTVSPTTNTEYTVVGTDTNGCSNTATQILLVNPLPPVAINSGVTSFTLNLGQSITLNASGALTYNWTSGNVSCDSCASNTESPIASTQYCVAGTDINGCRDSVCLNVVVEKVCDVFIPDAFSPNGDGHNDVFKVYGNCITELTLQVFDRWGNQVFNGSNVSSAWDGTYGGNLMNTGSYVYQVQYTLSTGEKTKTKGNFSLMR
jgi:gliding motility-associated-like protein